MNESKAWIQTYTGKKFFPLAPNPKDIDIHDIAHALSLQCRFAGHCSKFYSVAEHSVHVSWICSIEHALWGLLHDASEAYLVDLPRPLKNHTGLGTWYKDIEKKLMEEITHFFRLDPVQPDSVREADERMLTVEAISLMSSFHCEWDNWNERLAKLTGYEPRPSCWSPEESERRFLQRFDKLFH